MKQLVFFLCLFLACGCTSNKQEKHQSKRNNIVNVHNQVKEIDTGDVLVSNTHRVMVFDDYLVIEDAKAFDKYMHIFDAHTYKYLASTGNVGQGPGELAGVGGIGWDKTSRTMYVTDYGSMNIYAFQMDSVLANPLYKPGVKQKLNMKATPLFYTYINDTLAFCNLGIPKSESAWDEVPAKFNFKTGEAQPITYPQPDLQIKRVRVNASAAHGLVTVISRRYDLMSILGFDGRLQCHIYGPDWDERNLDLHCFESTVFYQDKILALYDGRKYSEYKQCPRILVFNLEGDYIKTLETGYEVDDFALDETNHRLILSCDDEIQFGYLDLDEVL